MYRYAQINTDTGSVIADSYLSGEVDYPYMIPIADDFDLKNKTYINNKWVEGKLESKSEPQPTQLDEIQATLDYIIMLNE